MIGCRPCFSLVLATVLSNGCGAKMLLPPKVDLFDMGRFALIVFTSERPAGDLPDLVTEYFGDELLTALPETELLDLGRLTDVLEGLGRERFDGRAARALGEEHDVGAIFIGHLEVSVVDPRSALSESLYTGDMLSVRLTVSLVSAESGRTIWRNSATATEVVGEFEVVDGNIQLTADDPDDAYGHLIEHLVYEITKDFRPVYM